MDEEKDTDRKVEEIMRVIDVAGAPPLPKQDWVVMLDKIIEECKSRRIASQEEIDNEDDGCPF